jgi:hypothetical protein
MRMSIIGLKVGRVNFVEIKNVDITRFHPFKKFGTGIAMI